jgi:DMSO/TMAO reductase YedYZ molybdopterin-dependent catalytic subunit
MFKLFKSSRRIGSFDAQAAVATALRELPQGHIAPARRAFLRGGLSAGGLALLSGCSLVDESSVETALLSVSRMNDRVQGWLFDPQRLAPTYDRALALDPFPFNAYYGEDEVRELDDGSFRLEVTGLVADRHVWSLEELHTLPVAEQVTRHICVEGWSAIGHWSGIPFAHFLKRVGADLSAKYIGFSCDDDYHTSIDMATALHPQTLLVTGQNGRTLEPRHGYPLKLRIPTKLGYKNPKHIRAITVTNRYPGGYWEDQGYNWFGGS